MLGNWDDPVSTWDDPVIFWDDPGRQAQRNVATLVPLWWEDRTHAVTAKFSVEVVLHATVRVGMDRRYQEDEELLRLLYD